MRVRYEGGELDGMVVERAPEVFATHGQREVLASDGRHELYRHAEVLGAGGPVEEVEHVFRFDSPSVERRLDDEQEPLAAAADNGAAQ